MKKLFFIAALAASVASASAQSFGAPPTGLSAVMLKLFGDTKPFTGKAEARLLDKDRKEVGSVPMTVALREGKLRGELNLSEAKSSAMPTELVTAMKQAGMDKVITIVRADKKATFVSYPGAQAYTEVPFRTNELALEKIEFTEVAKETIDGHPCVKKKTSIADSRGRPQEFFVWHASDLKDFPLQMELPQRANKVIVKLQSPKMETPDVSVFDVPASYTKYTNAQDLMQAAMMKMFSTPPAAK